MPNSVGRILIRGRDGQLLWLLEEYRSRVIKSRITPVLIPSMALLEIICTSDTPLLTFCHGLSRWAGRNVHELDVSSLRLAELLENTQRAGIFLPAPSPWVGRGAVTCAQWPEAGFAASRQRTALPLDLWQLHRSCQMTAPPSAESSYTTSPNPSFSCIQRLWRWQIHGSIRKFICFYKILNTKKVFS